MEVVTWIRAESRRTSWTTEINRTLLQRWFVDEYQQRTILHYTWWGRTWRYENIMSRAHFTLQWGNIPCERVDSWKHKDRPSPGCEGLLSSRTWWCWDHDRIFISRPNSFLGSHRERNSVHREWWSCKITSAPELRQAHWLGQWFLCVCACLYRFFETYHIPSFHPFVLLCCRRLLSVAFLAQWWRTVLGILHIFWLMFSSTLFCALIHCYQSIRPSISRSIIPNAVFFCPWCRTTDECHIAVRIASAAWGDATHPYLRAAESSSSMALYTALSKNCFGLHQLSQRFVNIAHIVIHISAMRDCQDHPLKNVKKKNVLFTMLLACDVWFSSRFSSTPSWFAIEVHSAQKVTKHKVTKH